MSLLDTLAWAWGMFTHAFTLPRAIKNESANIQKLLSAETAAIMSDFKYPRGTLSFPSLNDPRAAYEKFSKRYYTDAAWGKRGVTWPTEDASEFAADPVTEEDMAATMAKSTNVATLLSLAQRVQSGEIEILNLESFKNAAWDPDARVMEITFKQNPNFNSEMDAVLFGKPQQPKESKPAEPFGSRDLDID